MAVCASCRGSGECSHWNGTGKIIGFIGDANCLRCGATGICPACKGTGKIKD